MDKQFTKVKAVFNPKNRDTLKTKLQIDIGKEFVFQYMYMMDEHDKFPGVWALISMDKTFSGFGLWVAEFDLEII